MKRPRTSIVVDPMTRDLAKSQAALSGKALKDWIDDIVKQEYKKQQEFQRRVRGDKFF